MALILPVRGGGASGAPGPVATAGPVPAAGRPPGWARRGRKASASRALSPAMARAHRQHDVQAVRERGAHRAEQGGRSAAGGHVHPGDTPVRTAAAAPAGSPARPSWRGRRKQDGAQHRHPDRGTHLSHRGDQRRAGAAPLRGQRAQRGVHGGQHGQPQAQPGHGVPGRGEGGPAGRAGRGPHGQAPRHDHEARRDQDLGADRGVTRGGAAGPFGGVCSRVPPIMPITIPPIIGSIRSPVAKNPGPGLPGSTAASRTGCRTSRTRRRWSGSCPR